MKLFRLLPFLAVPLMAQQSITTTLPPPVSGPTVDPNKVVLQIGDVKVTAQQVEDIIDIYPANAQVFYRGLGRQQFAENMVRLVVLSDEGRKRKLNETEKFKEQARFSESNLIAQTLGNQLTQSLKVDDAMLHKYFDDHLCEYQVWHPRQILIRVTGSPLPLRPGEKDLTDAEALAKAQDLRKRIAIGADFGELARTESDDTTTGANDGDLREVRHGQTVPSLEEAICKMNAGEIGDPVKTPFGYHIVKLDSKQAKSFDDLKAEIEQRLRPEAARKLIDEWIAKVKVIKDPEYFAPPTPNEVAAPGPKKP
jgi:peptidyl-prolyl cis-trans isomerase C